MSKLWIPFCASLVLTSACSNGPDSSSTTPVPEAPQATAAPTTKLAPSVQRVAEATAPAANPPESTRAVTAQPAALTGPVLETMDAGGYTYVLIKTTTGEAWAAGPPTKVEVGQLVEIVDSLPMTNFESSSLNRKFDEIYFCSSIGAPNEDMVGAEGHMAVNPQPNAEGKITPATSGHTVGNVIANSSDHVDKEVLIRARVVKFSPDIMKKNWLHIQDGSGTEGANDLTITTMATVAVGDVVLVKGKLIADKDFGFGYFYDLIVEDAEVTVE
jgi:hypothetical protein